MDPVLSSVAAAHSGSIWSPHAIGVDAPIDNDPIDEDQETPNKFDLMDGFPKFMKKIVKEPGFYKGVERLLNVQPANQIKDPIFDSVLQKRFDHYLSTNRANIPGAQFAEPARLATGVPVGRPTTGFRQFSTIGSLLSINERQNRLASQKPPAGKPIMIATEVVVERFEVEGPAGKQYARVLHTSRGSLTLRRGKTNVILAMGAIPATTILLNSLDETIKNRETENRSAGRTEDRRTGKRFTSHFRSQIKARFRPNQNWRGAGNRFPSEPVMSTCHVRGRDPTSKLQWHIQIQGSYEPEGYQDERLSPEEKAQLSSRLFMGLAPDNGDTLTPEQLEGSGGWVIISCSTLGEHPPTTKSHVELNKSNNDVTTNVRLHLELPDSVIGTNGLWKTMEESTFEAIQVIADGRRNHLQYWNRDNNKWENGQWENGKWEEFLPYRNRVSSLFHEASTTFMTESFVRGEPNDASVDKSYRPYGLEKGNVYVTGAGLFPTAGSWNPTPTIVGFAQHLAKTLVVPPRSVRIISQKELVPTKFLGRPYIIGFKADGSVSIWSFSGQELNPPSNLLRIHDYTNKKHVRLLADTTGNGFYDLVMFGDTGVHIATRNRTQNKFNNFVTVPVLEDFTYDAGWRVDKHIRYMADVRDTGRADVIGFGDTGVFLSENHTNPEGDGFRFTPPSIVLHDLCFDQGWRLYKHLRFLADFDGSGYPDIIGFGEETVVLAKNNGDGTFEAPRDVLGPEFTYSGGWRVSKHVRTPADITGNGRPDIIGFGDAGVCIATNDGKGTLNLANSGKPVLKNFGYDQNWRVEKHLRLVVDVNGNGLGDIVGFGNKGVYVSRNKGNGFEEAKLAIRDFGCKQGWKVEEHLRFMVDVTGDGCADIIGFKGDKAYVAFNDGEGNFGHAQSLITKFETEYDSDFESRSKWAKDWNPSTFAGYVRSLGSGNVY